MGKMGRVRDQGIDESILTVAQQHLATHGYEAMSVAAVAEEAGTTRQALYRRWPDKAELAAAVIARMSAGTDAPPTDEPFIDLVAELTDFRRGVSRPGRLSLVGAMLQEGTDPKVLARYRAQVVAPRRQRIRTILERAAEFGLIDADADLEVAITMCTGCWYGRALAGSPVPPYWPKRTATLVWRAVGGDTSRETLGGPPVRSFE